MFDVFLQRDVNLDVPDCGGVFSAVAVPCHQEDLIFHFGNQEINHSEPIAQSVISAFTLLANDANAFFSLCDDPEKLDRNELEKYLQSSLTSASAKDPLVHMKEIVARPILDLKEEEIKQPTSRVKKFAPRALDYLASHSEDWRNRSFVGVHPQRLLSLVRDDRWDTYENRLLYTLCKILNDLITQRLRDLKNVDDGYLEIQRYYEIRDRINHEAMLVEIDQMLMKYSADRVEENRKKIDETVSFLKRLQLSIAAFWNAPLFSNLKQIPNVEVNVNHFVPTNVLMNNQHYRFLPEIQRKVVSFYSREHSKKVKFEEQKNLFANERAYVKHCIDDFAREHNSYWKELQPCVIEKDLELVIECGSKRIRFSFATSVPSTQYLSRMNSLKGDSDTISILVYPQVDLYLDGTDDYSTLHSMFTRPLPEYGSYSVLGLSPQSVFSKLFVQRVLFQWIWPMVMAEYPVKLPVNKFLGEYIPEKSISEGFLLAPCDEHGLARFAEDKKRRDRILSRDKSYDIAKDKETEFLREANGVITTVLQCPCCGGKGSLSDHAKAQNYLFRCSNCGCRWGRNGNVIKWMKPDQFGYEMLYGKLESFEVSMKSFTV